MILSRTDEPHPFTRTGQFMHFGGMLATDPHSGQAFHMAIIGHVELATIGGRIHQEANDAYGSALLGFVIRVEISNQPVGNVQRTVGDGLMLIADEQRPLLKSRAGHFVKARLKYCNAIAQVDSLKILGFSFTNECHRSLGTRISGPGSVRNRKAWKFERALGERDRCNERLPAINGHRFQADLRQPEFTQRFLEPVFYLKALWIARTADAECDDAPYPGEHLARVRLVGGFGFCQSANFLHELYYSAQAALCPPRNSRPRYESWPSSTR